MMFINFCSFCYFLVFLVILCNIIIYLCHFILHFLKLNPLTSRAAPAGSQCRPWSAPGSCEIPTALFFSKFSFLFAVHKNGHFFALFGNHSFKQGDENNLLMVALFKRATRPKEPKSEERKSEFQTLRDTEEVEAETNSFSVAFVIRLIYNIQYINKSKIQFEIK